MVFEGGYDDQWILQDLIKDRAYQLTVGGVVLQQIEDPNLRRLLAKMHGEIGRHYEQLMALAHHQSRVPAAPMARPGAATARRAVPPYRAWDATDRPMWQGENRPTQGWNSSIPQGDGAYEGHTERHREQYASRPVSARGQDQTAIGSYDETTRGWRSPISQGRGAYQGSTQRFQETSAVGDYDSVEVEDGADYLESERRKDDAGYRGVPRYRDRDDHTGRRP